ncbi:NUDIX domain-containing protein [Rufibacter glacialis]|uniref:NUDIX domain-containing protein n=1 Tax=Rufibacter glacialis TaxID=1259555 RepID=A0A5M8Q7A9_9BACT|nr:NUDIX hydrolase [Rufibacter glacialis]KAA6431777.1 NUDIX hydrolase [Rufibacter glacialis]GGK81665.1 NUDIX domain-containing protein [Rufibacter glacialis]
MENIHPLAETYSHKTRVRVCGLLVQNNTLLLACHKAAFGSGFFWMPPGGGLDFGEKVKDCLVREFREETGLEVEVGRFLYLNEFLRSPLHAIELFFEVKLVKGTLALGSDPEHASHAQLLEDVKFLSIRDMFQLKRDELHPILHALVNLDDLFIPRQIFLD